ncbi:OsmC family protein [Actinokineospora bangkokensis]|uniref:Osmotically inducible protein C n=1 Tax=Actinokineospora bangkokensis TaxID=1193682 RepID=A0A1Q9LTV5_9PSEU|nr:OsmC family protein [Actinokineospora bangkokensis]OLR95458.1 osmotically inducible protein C [Actinokineospora bangkokensis]
MSGVRVERIGTHAFTAANDRGARVRVGRVGEPGAFTPVELLLAAAAGCVGITAEDLVVRRTSPGARIGVTAEDVRPVGAHQLDAVDLAVDLDLDGLDDAARAELVAVVERAVGMVCTVTRTLKASTRVDMAIR